MPRKRVRGDTSGGALEWWGDTELMRKLDSLASSEEMNRAVFDALMKSTEPVVEYQKEFMDSHLKGKPIPYPYTQTTLPRGKGQSNKWLDRRVWWKNGAMTVQVGFRKRDYKPGMKHENQQGLQALFLDIGTRMYHGTPRITPTFFIYYSVANNWAAIKRIQNEVIFEHILDIWTDPNRKETG